jgi:hypothetical protein
VNDAQSEARRLAERFTALKRRLGVITALIGSSAIALIIAAGAVSDPQGGDLFGLPLS